MDCRCMNRKNCRALEHKKQRIYSSVPLLAHISSQDGLVGIATGLGMNGSGSQTASHLTGTGVHSRGKAAVA